MGLFGLFATLFGLGAMAKDGVSRWITSEEAKQQAEAKNRSWYLTGNGAEIYSTATGRRASTTMDFTTKHEWLVDARTGERIEDLTLRRNKEKTEENRRNAHAEGKRFYRTAMFDVPPCTKPTIYICDDFPGIYFDKHSIIDHGIIEIFQIREIEPDKYKKDSYRFKFVGWNEGPDWWYTHDLKKVTIQGKPYEGK